MMKKQIFAGAAALAFAGGATAADPVGNFLAGLDGAAVNLDSTLDALVVGNSSGTANGLTALVTEFGTTVAADTAGEDLAIMGADLGNQLNATGQQFLYPLLDQLTMPGAAPLRPLAQFYLDSGLLAQGIPFVRSNGSVVLFEPAASRFLEGFGLPITTVADLVGPGGELSTVLGQILAGGVPGGSGGGMGADIPGADILLGFLPVGGEDMASGLGPDALLALLPIPGGDGAEGGLPGADVLLGLIPGVGGSASAAGSASAEGGLPGLDTLLVLIPMGENGSPLGMIPLGPDALLALLDGLSLPGMNGA